MTYGSYMPGIPSFALTNCEETIQIFSDNVSMKVVHIPTSIPWLALILSHLTNHLLAPKPTFLALTKFGEIYSNKS